MSEEGTGSKATDGDLLPDLKLKSAANSIAEARARLEMRQSVGKDLRGAIKHILEAQEKLEGRGTVAELRLDLLEAIRLIGVVESVLKSSEPGAVPERPPQTVSQHVVAPETGARVESSLPDSGTGSDSGTSRAMTPILEPDLPVPAPPERLSLSALSTASFPDQGSRSDLPTGRGLPLSSEPVLSRGEVPEADAVVADADAVVAEPGEESEADALNRRAFERLAATYPIQLQPPYNGFSNSDLTQLPISGITLNLSRGGMLAQIEQGILRHGRYLIRFLGAGQNVRPEIMWGRVRRSRAADAGWEVGIEFDSPLEILRP